MYKIHIQEYTWAGLDKQTLVILLSERCIGLEKIIYTQTRENNKYTDKQAVLKHKEL